MEKSYLRYAIMMSSGLRMPYRDMHQICDDASDHGLRSMPLGSGLG